MGIVAGALLSGVLAAGVAVPVTVAAGDETGQPGERRTFAATIEAGWQGTLAAWESFVVKVPNGPGKIDDAIRGIDGAVDKATTVPNPAGSPGAAPGGGAPDPAAPAAVQIVQAIDAGCPEVATDRAKKIEATAISLAESNGRDEAEGDTTITDGTWGPSFGKWQIRSMHNQQGTGRARDADRLRDPVFNARSMCEISSGGTDWRPWSVYLHGTYKDRLAEAEATVDATARVAAVQRGGGYQWPCDGPVASGFGPRSAPAGSEGPGSSDHQGLDLGCANGSDVRAARSGTVTFAGYLGSYGNVVFVDHGDATTRYGHLAGIVATVNSRVDAGQLIGRVGSTGNSTGPHLHFEVRPGDTPADPKLYLSPAA